MKKFISNKRMSYYWGIVFLITVWEAISLIVPQKQTIFPDPVSSVSYASTLLKSSYIYSCILSSIWRMIAGFILALFFALCLGSLAGINDFLEGLLSPFLTMMRSVPTASFVYLFLVIAGARLAPVFIVFLVSFPILYEGVVSGLHQIPSEVNKALSLENNRKFFNYFKILLPMAFPSIFSAGIAAFGLSFKIEIMAEIITGDTRSGLGCAILAAQKNDPANMIPVFGYSLIAVVLILVLDRILNCMKKWWLNYPL